MEGLLKKKVSVFLWKYKWWFISGIIIPFAIVMAIPYFYVMDPSLYGSSQEAVSLVERAIQCTLDEGEETTFSKIKSGKRSDLLNKDLYVWIIDAQGMMLAHPDNTLLGQDLFTLQDKKGRFFIKEILGVAKTKGKGWVDYWWDHPISKKIIPKRTYVQMFGDRIYCCGIYVFDKK